MKHCVGFFAILSLTALTQVIGTVQKIDKNQLQVKRSDGLVTFLVDEKTTVTKIKKQNDLSLLATGDEVRINYYGEGTLTAVDISAKVTLSGAIVERASNQFMLLPDSKVEAKSAGTKTSVLIFLSSATTFGTSRKLLTIGRRVHVEGWDAGDGVIEADKVAICDTDLPLGRVAQPQRK